MTARCQDLRSAEDLGAFVLYIMHLLWGSGVVAYKILVLSRLVGDLRQPCLPVSVCENTLLASSSGLFDFINSNGRCPPTHPKGGGVQTLLRS